MDFKSFSAWDAWLARETKKEVAWEHEGLIDTGLDDDEDFWLKLNTKFVDPSLKLPEKKQKLLK